MMLLTLSASVNGLHPPPRSPATSMQNTLLFWALAFIAVGNGSTKPCSSAFGQDQFDEADEREVQEKYSFLNWFLFANCMGVLFGITLMVYIQVEKGWGWGFGVPTAATLFSIVVFVTGSPLYRYHKPMGSALTRFVQVAVAACRNHRKGVVLEGELYEVMTNESDIAGARKLHHTPQYRFLDKAAVMTDQNAISIATTNRWKLCTVTQVEEFKSFIRVLPVWASTIALYMSSSQIPTFFISQATIMDRKLGPNFIIPSSSIPIFAAINPLLITPLYEGIAIPMLRRYTGHRHGITSLQRMGVGCFISIFALASAAIIEKQRRDRDSPKSMSVFWPFPQFFLLGSAQMFVYIGQLEFFYDEATDGTRTLCNAMFLTEFGIGNWLAGALIKIVETTTGGVEKGWIRNDLNESQLDYFYWILCGINAGSLLVYLVVASAYKGRDSGIGRGRN